MKADYCEGKVHIIEEGDTLYQLSRRYKIPLALILRANPFTDVYNLQVGDEICIPIELGRPPEQPNCSHCQGSCEKLERPKQMDNDVMTDSSRSDFNISTDQLNRQNNNIKPDQMNQSNQQNNDVRMGQPEHNIGMGTSTQTNNNAGMNQSDQSEQDIGMGTPTQINSNVRMNQPSQSDNNNGMGTPTQTNNNVRLGQPNRQNNNVRMDTPTQTNSNVRLNQPNLSDSSVQQTPPFMLNFPTMPEMPNMNNSGINLDRPITLPSFPNLFSYIVEEGESLGDILDNFDVNLEDLLNFNDLDELQLCPGSVVKVPIRRENSRD